MKHSVRGVSMRHVKTHPIREIDIGRKDYMDVPVIKSEKAEGKRLNINFF